MTDSPYLTDAESAEDCRLSYLDCIAEMRGRLLAQGIETRRAETRSGSVHESAVGKADAPMTTCSLSERGLQAPLRISATVACQGSDGGLCLSVDVLHVTKNDDGDFNCRGPRGANQ